MCTYGIGLPFDHPIWQSLPPCQCGGFDVVPRGPVEFRWTVPPQWVPVATTRGKRKRGKRK